ncbi:MAG: hypothetical protein OEY10_00230 [Nitrosopumilus sp.]|nr:hypothetical protein [Nitrosopumilus sp.]
MSKFEVGQIVYVCQITNPEHGFDQRFDGMAVVSAMNHEYIVLRYVKGRVKDEEYAFKHDDKHIHIGLDNSYYLEKMERIKKRWKEHDKKEEAEKEREEEIRKTNEDIKDLWPWWRLW